MWLGLTFNWGVLVAAACARGEITTPDLLLYAALVFWTLGYDTIYAIQDLEDDALVGVKSTARRLGASVRPAISVIYAVCIVLCIAAGYLAAGLWAAVVTAPFALHLVQQAIRTDASKGLLALVLFRANRDAGILLFAGWAFIAATFWTITA